MKGVILSIIFFLKLTIYKIILFILTINRLLINKNLRGKRFEKF